MKLFGYTIITLGLLFLFAVTAFGQNTYIPQVLNKQADTTPALDRVVVVDLPIFQGAPTYSWIGENGLVWWIYVGFSPQECVPPGGVPGNVFWQRVLLTNLEGKACFDVTNLVLGDFVDECSSAARPSGFAYNDKAASFTPYGPGDFRVCHVPLSLVGPLGQNSTSLVDTSDVQLRPLTTKLDEVDWPWPSYADPNHHEMRHDDTFEVLP